MKSSQTGAANAAVQFDAAQLWAWSAYTFLHGKAHDSQRHGADVG